ncbi:hypothetical protein [Flavobacterium sp. 3HN19-14]|uniref:hypothetical protein n=1 Tax=Flavobacterium sp. 3HN19-14 TaxID=3448133 RepID=UPI003EE1BE36
MKKILFIGCLLLLIGCKSKHGPEKDKIVILKIEEVNSVQKNKSYELGKRLLNTCNTSKFRPFTNNEATADVIKNTTLEKLTRTCQKIRIKYGNFKDIKLVEVIQNKTQNVTIYRYKADYQWKHTVKELRVTMNEENKISSIKSKDWANTYQP